MISVKTFVNNPYQENTYLLFDESNECVFVDPGMYSPGDHNAVDQFIKDNQLKPVLLLNTHCHIDHVLGNKFIFDMYGLKPQLHKGELPVLHFVPSYAAQQGFQYDISPEPDTFLPESGTISFGTSTLEIIFAPGHSPAHLCFYSKEDRFLIGGDVLFQGSIGRTDLPGGDFATLISNIERKLFTLPDEVTVYPGHGPETQIGYEKLYNPFFKH